MPGIRRPTLASPRSPTIKRERERLLSGQRLDVRAEGLRAEVREKEFLPLIVDGKVLTGPESEVVRALEDLNEPYIVKLLIGRPRELGSGEADIYLPARNLIYEYQGPFHNTDQGRARDFRRLTIRREFGAADVIYVFQSDLANIHQFLLRTMGKRG